MNIILLKDQLDQEILKIDDPRQFNHLRQHLNVQLGDQLKVGLFNQARYLTEVIQIDAHAVWVKIISQQPIPEKLPVTLIVALPRSKVLRRLIMDSVTFGVEKIILLHSYRVDKSYWQTPYLSKLDEYIQLGLEQAGDVFPPEIVLEKRFKPFVEDRLSILTQQQATFIGHPYVAEKIPTNFNQACQVVIGPEGGFIPYEIELFKKNGCQIVSLGNRILRTEMAIPTILARLFS